MKLREVFQLAWDNKEKIAEGLWHKYVEHKPEIEAEAQRRIYICTTNGKCGYYDPEGKPETSVIVGKPACSQCHCNIDLKCHTPSHHCSLLDIQIQRLKELISETDVTDIAACRVAINQLQQQGIDVGTDPLWDEMMTPDQEKEIKQKEWEQQFKYRHGAGS